MSVLLKTAEILTLPSAARTVDFVTDFVVEDFTVVQIDVDLTAGTLGFTISRIGTDGVAYPLAAEFTVTTKQSVLIAPGAPAGTGAHQGISELPGQRLRIAWNVTTSATFSASVVGR